MLRQLHTIQDVNTTSALNMLDNFKSLNLRPYIFTIDNTYNNISLSIIYLIYTCILYMWYVCISASICNQPVPLIEGERGALSLSHGSVTLLLGYS